MGVQSKMAYPALPGNHLSGNLPLPDIENPGIVIAGAEPVGVQVLDVGHVRVSHWANAIGAMLQTLEGSACHTSFHCLKTVFDCWSRCLLKRTAGRFFCTRYRRSARLRSGWRILPQQVHRGCSSDVWEGVFADFSNRPHFRFFLPMCPAKHTRLPPAGVQRWTLCADFHAACLQGVYPSSSLFTFSVLGRVCCGDASKAWNRISASRLEELSATQLVLCEIRQGVPG